ncbi:uncharacterized protein LOC124117335 [Haliotis rufescens]|uniref:uncharacterized protein LOC124117335 n=1 Tax=Haliotis rufescens TaxID=6454 RepID=UPI001EAFC8C9|nr:uncharacterized protein LOC124117335 [Haliotis rufescens]
MSIMKTGICVLVFAPLIENILGNPVSGPWSSPCGPPAPVISWGDFFDTPTSGPSNSDLTAELYIQTRGAHQGAISLRETATIHRLDSSVTLALILEGSTHVNFPAPDDVIFWTDKNSTTAVLKKDYENLSIAYVFLEAVLADDSSDFNSTLKATLEPVMEKILAMLCSMESVLSNHNQSIGGYVTREVMPNALREITSDSVRSQRDYIITKDVVHLLTRVKESYAIMKNGYQ